MNPETFRVIAEATRARSGLVLTADKGYMLETRLGGLVDRHKLGNLDGLARALRGPGAEPLATAVTEALTVNETSFFRDGKPFDHLRALLPGLAARRPPASPLRIWSAACSTGQEAYSVALLAEELGSALGGRAVEIVGTDLSAEVVQRAREGLFTQFEVQRGLPIRLLVKHFRQEAGRWRIDPRLAARTRFEVRNLLGDLRSLGRFDVVFCRNVLIYFDAPTKTRVLNALAGQLAPDGVLYLGGAETILGLTERLMPWPGQRGAYTLPQAVALAG